MTARPRQRDPHSEIVELWLDQVLADPATKPIFLIAWAISCYFNRTSGAAWAGVDEYATRAHTHPRNVQRALHRLVLTGHLSAVIGGGRKLTNQYRPILKNSGAGAAVSDAENPGADAALSDHETPASAPPFPTDKTPALVVKNPGVGGIETPGNPGADATQPLKERLPLKTTDSRAAARSDDNPDLVSAFERWWVLYPKHEAKAAAFREYAKIIRSGRATTAELDRGAMIYAAACDGREARYIARADRWLKDGRWTDEPTAAAPPPRPMGFVDIAEALALDAEERERERRDAEDREREP
jgi:hypothetical protein